VFKKVDQDGNGTIDISELEAVMKNMGEILSKEEV
jgi:Ca2+-binding EF-hand superfamily protein